MSIKKDIMLSFLFICSFVLCAYGQTREKSYSEFIADEIEKESSMVVYCNNYITSSKELFCLAVLVIVVLGMNIHFIVSNYCYSGRRKFYE